MHYRIQNKADFSSPFIPEALNSQDEGEQHMSCFRGWVRTDTVFIQDKYEVFMFLSSKMNDQV